MENLIEELRINAGAHQLELDRVVMTKAAVALESQAREIERLKEGQESLILVRDDYKRQANEYRDLWSRAALKAQPIGVVPTQWSKSFTECWPVERGDLEGDWAVGSVMRDGDEIYYPVITVEAAQYDAPGESEKIARALVTLLNPEREVARLNQPASGGDEQYPPCDYCGSTPKFHPWHGSGMINGVESCHIHACDDCRHKLPNSNVASGADEPIRYWFIGDAGQEKGSIHCKKSVSDGSLAFFESEYDANRAARRHPGTEVYPVEYYRKPQARAALPVREAVAEGWQLVPVEPTQEMITAAEDAYMPFGDMDIALRCALLAAPSPSREGE